jgi:hypothetical protein
MFDIFSRIFQIPGNRNLQDLAVVEMKRSFFLVTGGKF